MRLFIAIEFDDTVLSCLETISADLRKAGVSGRYSDRALWHLTLVFIGQTNRSNDVIRIVRQVRANPFWLTLNGLGHFQRDGGDIVWAGVKAGPALFDLRRQLEIRFLDNGFDIDTKPYRPHITLGRQMTLPPSLALGTLPLPEQSMTVRHVNVMQSERINGTLVYTPLYKQSLSSQA